VKGLNYFFELITLRAHFENQGTHGKTIKEVENRPRRGKNIYHAKL